MKHRVVVGITAVAAMTFAGIASAVAVTGPVTIRVSMDLPSWGGPGPRVFLVEDVTAGAGPELTGADEVANPSELCGNLAVDIDPDARTITIGPDTEDNCYFELITVEIETAEIGSVELSSGNLAPGGGADLGIAVGPTGVVLTWTLADGASELVPDGTVVFSYELADIDDPDDGEDDDEADPATPAVADPNFAG